MTGVGFVNTKNRKHIFFVSYVAWSSLSPLCFHGYQKQRQNLLPSVTATFLDLTENPIKDCGLSFNFKV